MDKEEKQIIYNLLRTASRNVYGYTVPAFENPEYKEPENKMEQVMPESKPQIVPETQVQQAKPEMQVQPQMSQNSELIVPSHILQNSDQKPSGATLDEIVMKISRCTRCQLARTRTNTVPGVGARQPEVMVIGEAPGQDEDNMGLPFVGKAGQLLDKMLNAIKLDRHSNCYIANVVKCRPPQNRDPLPEEVSACSAFLEAQIHILKPKMILCAGRVSAHHLLKNELSMNGLRGKKFEYNNIPVYVTYHPSAVLRDPALKGPVWDDLRLLGSELKEISPSYAALFNRN